MIKNELAKSMFDSYPAINEFFATADSQFFFTEAQAENHAQSLKDKEVEKFERTAKVKKEAAPVVGMNGTKKEAAPARTAEVVEAQIAEAKTALEAETDDKKKAKIQSSLTKLEAELTQINEAK